MRLNPGGQGRRTISMNTGVVRSDSFVEAITLMVVVDRVTNETNISINLYL